MEARPFVYLATTYLLAAAFLNGRRAVRAVLWAIVVANGFWTTRPFARVTSGKPNLGSEASMRVTMGPDQPPL